jgi:hypothetical protein
MSTIRRQRREVADITSHVLDKLFSLDLRSGEHLGAFTESKILGFLLGCDFFLMHDVIDTTETLSGGSKYGCFNPTGIEDELAETCWPVDQGTVVRHDEDKKFFFSRIKSVTPQEVRGRVSMVVPKMIRFWHASIYDNSTWFASDRVVGLINKRWRALDLNIATARMTGAGTIVSGRIDSEQIRDEINNSVAAELSLALTRRYDWHVALGPSKDGPRILLPTNPTGCLKFFQNRQRAATASRRAALRHWVSNHYRETDSTGLSYVRDHLRGHTEFVWSDLECELLVSAFDLEKNEAFRQEAELWRAQRQHNRVKVRLKQRAV